MPIVFRCEHCKQKLRVSSRKAGHSGKCPKCEQPFKVPKSSSPEVPPDSPAAVEPRVPITPPPPPEPVTSFVAISTRDDDTEVVYDDQDFDAPYEPYHHVDHRKVAVSRKILVAQGLLLLVVAASAFAMGTVMGKGGGSTNSSNPAVPSPCVVTGKVNYTTESGQKFPDEGSVVYIVPQHEKPDLDDKITPDGLRPSDPLPGDTHAGLQMIRMLGGASGRVDAKGEFRLRLPSSGKFYMLTISKHGKRKASHEINKTELAQMGRYFLPATDLIADRRYRWSSEDIFHDRRINVVLE